MNGIFVYITIAKRTSIRFIKLSEASKVDVSGSAESPKFVHPSVTTFFRGWLISLFWSLHEVRLQ